MEHINLPLLVAFVALNLLLFTVRSRKAAKAALHGSAPLPRPAARLWPAPSQRQQEKDTRMKIAGILLIIAGIAAIAYGGFSYTSHKKAVDMGPMQISMSQQHSVPIPPILGLAGILGGAALLYFAPRRSV
jgi:hypothetical protein